MKTETLPRMIFGTGMHLMSAKALAAWTDRSALVNNDPRQTFR